MDPREFFSRLDSIQSAIHAANDKDLRRRLMSERELLSCEYAKHMDELGFVSFAMDDGRIVTPVWSVEGFAPGKSNEAREWLASKGVDWNGSAKSLRIEITKLLESGAALPPGSFGLHVTRTIRVRDGLPRRRRRGGPVSEER
jgi:hypothetical protein